MVEFKIKINRESFLCTALYYDNDWLQSKLFKIFKYRDILRLQFEQIICYEDIWPGTLGDTTEF